MSDPSPIIITVALDEGAFAWFEDLRQTHFPTDRNQVPAHLTLFHALPGDFEHEIAQALEARCQRQAPMTLSVTGPWFMGRGVAYRLQSPALNAVRSELAATFSDWLTRQDQAPFRPHITVQNKVEPEDARRLSDRLQLEFEPFDIVAEGLLAWRYLGGPWRQLARLPFAAQEPGATDKGEPG